MGRKQMYRDSTERQRAHRARIASVVPGNSARAATSALHTRISRPARLQALETAVGALLREYQDWLDRLPEPLQGTTQAERLGSTIDTLDQIGDLLADLDLPLGFGRD